MCTKTERTYSFAGICNWIRELSNSIKELSNTTNIVTRLQYEKNVGIRELSNLIKSSLVQLESSLIHVRIS